MQKATNAKEATNAKSSAKATAKATPAKREAKATQRKTASKPRKATATEKATPKRLRLESKQDVQKAMHLLKDNGLTYSWTGLCLWAECSAKTGKRAEWLKQHGFTFSPSRKEQGKSACWFARSTKSGGFGVKAKAWAI